MADAGYYFTVMAFAPATNDSDSQFVRKIKLRDTAFLSKRQLFIFQKMTSGCMLKYEVYYILIKNNDI